METLYVLCMVTALMVYYTQANEAGTQHNRFISEIGEDLRNRELAQQLATLSIQLTKRITDFETEYVQRLTALETKLQMYVGSNTNNNGLEVAAEMVKLVMDTHKRINVLNGTFLHTVQQQERKIGNLNQSIGTLDGDIKSATGSLLHTVQQQEREIGSINQNISRLDADLKTATGTLLQTVQQQEREIGGINQNISTLEADLKTATDPSMVVFSGHGSIDGKVSDGSPIIFNYVQYSVGGGYNTTDGIFYCPIKGWYMFDVTIIANRASSASAHLMKNNNNMMHVYSGGSSDNQYPSGSRSITLHLNINDTVYIRSNGHSYSRYSSISITLI